MDYDTFIERLYNLQDLKYKEFHSKLINTNSLIGVRTPELKKIAKEISKGDYEEFFKNNTHKFYEENLVHGFVLGYLKVDFNDLKKYIDDFLPYIDNWAVCDMTASNLKIFNKSDLKQICFNEIKKYIYDCNPWINRFGYVLLLDYFIQEDYIDEIYKLCENYKDEYYVKMSIAWLLSICYIKFKEKTLNFLKQNKLDVWTHNKTIQKIIESNRVSKYEKQLLKGFKRK